MVKKTLEEPVRITTAGQCLHEFDLLKQALLIEETEDTWQNIDASLKRFTAAIRGGACEHHDEFLKRWKETDLVRGLVSAMSTERTRLSGTALDLVAATSRLGSYWDSAVPFYAPTIIKLLGRASKIYVTRATITLTALIKGTKSLAFIPYLIDGISEKSVTIRIGCADALLCCLSDTVNDTDASESRKQRSKDGLNKRINDIENAIKIGGRDRDPKVRAIFKRIWELYEQQWPTRAASLAQPLTPTIKRYLGIGSSSTLTSSHASHASSNGLPSRDINSNREKAPLSGHHRAGSKNATEGSQPPVTKSASAHTSKSIKSLNSLSALPKSGDLATLQKAMMVPLPPDDPEPREPSVTRAPGRARLISTRSKTPTEGSIHQAPPSGQSMKRSNSTMRAQRVPLPPQTDQPASSAIAKARTATRVPLQPIQTIGVQPGKDTATKPNPPSATGSAYHSSSTKIVASNILNEPPKATFKPARSASGTTQADSKPSHQPQQPLPPLQTRPMPRRAMAEPSNDKPASPPLVTNTLNVSVRSHTRKTPTEESIPIPQKREVFRPTKSSSKGSSATTLSSSKPSSTKTDLNSKSDSTATSIPSQIPTQPVKAPPRVDEQPETLPQPVLTALPSSSAPDAVPLSSSTQAPQPVSQPVPPLPPSTTLPLSIPLPSSEPPVPSTTLLPAESKLTTEPLPASQPMAEPLPLPEITLPPVVPVKAAQLASSLPAESTSSNDGIQSGLSLPGEATHRTIFHQSLPSKPAEAPSQSSNVPVKPFSFFLSGFGTPGPKICTRLPDDLIVPMSVPLPPSPNSPFVRINNQGKVAQGSHRKPIRNQRSPRPPTKPTSSRLNSTTSANIGDKDSEHGDMLSTPTHRSRGQSPSDGCVGAHQQPVVQEGVLVDFDHEDTIWIPRPPALHQDLLQLADNLGMNQASDGEDGPQEKRARITAETTCSSADSTLSSSRVLCDEAQELPTSRQHPPRRDPSMFHWDQPDLETDGDDSGEKTISCLREEPPFFPDVTVNEGTSFHTHFLGGLNPHNQSTPAASGGVREVLSRRFEMSQVSP